MEKAGDDSFKNAKEIILLEHLPPGLVSGADPAPHFQSWVCWGGSGPVPAWTECSGRTDGRGEGRAPC